LSDISFYYYLGGFGGSAPNPLLGAFFIDLKLLGDLLWLSFLNCLPIFGGALIYFFELLLFDSDDEEDPLLLELKLSLKL